MRIAGCPAVQLGLDLPYPSLSPIQLTLQFVGVLARVDLADYGVIRDADDGVVGRPRPLVADGAVVGLVPGWSVW